MQVVWPEPTLVVEELDVSIEGDSLESAKRILAELTKRSFDIGASPPLRVTLLKHSECRHYLLFVVHNIVFDG